MMVSHLEILVEDASLEVVVRELVPKIAPALPFRVYPFQGKQDLLTNLPKRLRGYRGWLPPGWRILVVVDRDNEDCAALKARLESMAKAEGFATRSGRGGSYELANRLAIEELEAWYFGDWRAVTTAYPRVAPTVPRKAGFRNPDAIRGGTAEALERILKRAGYFKTGLRKLEAARAIAPHLDPATNTSRSFQGFRKVIEEALAESVASPAGRGGT